MAEPSEGAYALINVASQKALDVYWLKNAYQEWVMDNTRHATWNCQTWIFDNQSNGWQITNYATWKCLDASNASNWGRQAKDDNTTAQRWTVATDGNTATYGGETYNTYTLKPKNKSSYFLGRDSNGWVKLFSSASNATRWILVSVSILSDSGTYYIVPESDATKCIEIASGSKSNDAKARINARSNKAYQTFKAVVDSQNASVKLINVNSNKALDIWKTKNVPDWVGQYTINNNTSQEAEWGQRWWITKAGSVKLNGVNYPTYTLRSERYSSYYMQVVGTSINVKTYNAGSKAQRFAFIPSEYLDKKLSIPGIITTAGSSRQVRNGPGNITVSGLSFASIYSYFQVRYKVRTYKSSNGKRTYSDSKWMNVNGGSTANNGWGPSGTYSFVIKPVSGVVNYKAFSKKFTLNNSSAVAIDLIFECRAYSSIIKNGTQFKSVSDVKSSTIKLRQYPTITIKSLSMLMVPGSSGPAGDSAGIRVVLKDSLGEGCASLRGRLFGSDGIAISDWVNSSNETLNFVTGKGLYRLPKQNEKLTLSYIYVTKQDRLVITNSIAKTYSFSSSGNINIKYSKSISGSCTAIIKAPRSKADCCFMEIEFLSGTKLIPAQFYQLSGNEIWWICAPPLNKNVTIWVYSMGTTQTSVKRGSKIVNVPSHASVWNWGTSPKARYTQFATLLVNPDSPPQQTRTFTTDTQFHSPAGRVLPVAFASKALTIDLSVTGVSMDKDANYVAPTPLTPHNEVSYLIRLAELAGKGIHPTYRTPYGDWYQVGVSSVDVSKNAIGYSDVSITQRALED